MPDPAGARPLNRLARLMPILSWGPEYKREWFRADLIAGLTVAALVVPKSLGYAGIAQVPIEHGLYAAVAGAIIYALFGTSRQIAVNPSSSLAAVAASALVLAGVTGDDASVAFVSAIALASGLLYLIMAVLRMGWIAQFLSRAVIVGFLCGAAIDVTVGELRKITGTAASGDNAWQEFRSWINGLDDIHGTTFLVGTLSLVALFGLRRFVPRLPGTLIVVVGGLLASALFDLGDHGVSLVGDVPRGMPSVVFPDWDLLRDHAGYIVTAAAAITVIGFSQSAGDARAFATKHRYRADINQEALAQGASNIGAGFLQGIPVSTSLSSSALNDHAGAKTQVASLITGAVVVLTLFAFAPLFSDLPNAVLGAVIIEAVLMGMIDLREFQRMFRVKRADFWIAIAAVIGVVLSGVLAGVVIGVILSLGWLVYTVTSPPMPVLGRDRRTRVFQEVDSYPEGEQFPGILVLGIQGGLYFATSDALGDRINRLAVTAEDPPDAIVLDCRSMDLIDSQGSAQLGEIVAESQSIGITVRLARVQPQVLEILARDGVVDRVGAGNIHAGVNEAVETQLASASAGRS
jgi:high affinity sulfate transporter 1